MSDLGGGAAGLIRPVKMAKLRLGRPHENLPSGEPSYYQLRRLRR
jgi:hypothetical protein